MDLLDNDKPIILYTTFVECFSCISQALRVSPYISPTLFANQGACLRHVRSDLIDFNWLNVDTEIMYVCVMCDDSIPTLF